MKVCVYCSGRTIAGSARLPRCLSFPILLPEQYFISVFSKMSHCFIFLTSDPAPFYFYSSHSSLKMILVRPAIAVFSSRTTK